MGKTFTFKKGTRFGSTFSKGRKDRKGTRFGSTFSKGRKDRKGTRFGSTFSKGRTLKKYVVKRNHHVLAQGVKKNESFLPDYNKIKENSINMNSTSSLKLGGGEVRYNEQFIDLMEKLSNIMLKQGEPFRARAYQKAQETLMAYPDDITNVDQLKGKPGIGSTILEKLNEYVNTGTLKILEREKNNPINTLGEIYGVGPKKAKELVDKGITTIEQLRERQDEVLNDIQKVGLKYYEDILKRIPRSEIEEYKAIFDKDFENVAKLGSESHMEIVGSYRRGAENSGDIDVIITSTNPKVFVDFVNELIKEKIILELLSRGPTKCLVIAKIPSSDAARRVDFLYTSPEEFPFSILYFTGSKIFNTVMRHEALQKGLTMNEHGLYKMEGKKKGDKVDAVFKNEKDIFDYLNLVYKTPIERVDGRAVVLKSEVGNEAAVAVAVAVVPETVPEKNHTKTMKKKISVTGAKIKVARTSKKKQKEEIVDNNVDNNADQNLVQNIDVALTTTTPASENSIDKNSITFQLLNDFKKNGISVLQNLSEQTLSDMVVMANEVYRNKTPIISDNQFDILEDFIRNKFPDNKVIKLIGAPIPVGKNKATLPYEMWSMDKIKPDTKALDNWKMKYPGPYVISCKLDGVSGLYTTEGDEPKLYTRGDGKVGQDVSHFIPYLKLPVKKHGEKGVVIRGEFIIPKVVFDNKYKKDFANPRNFVSGVVNQKTVSEKIKDIHFVAYEVIVPTLKPSEQFEYLKTLDIEMVWFEKVNSNDLTNELLSNLLVDWRTNYLYEVDGVIVIDDKIYPRKSGNPEHAFAFKMVLSDQVAESKVVDVLWSPSKDGYLKPRVQIEPVVLGGVRIEFATGFNGAFIKDNKIGIGAVVEIIRSGDVIPYIRKVVVGAEEPKMPSVAYKWNETNVDIMLEDILSDETVKEKNITGFFRGIGVEGLSSGNISKIIKAGYDSVPKILNMTVQQLNDVEGFQLKTATKIYNGVKEKIAAASLLTLMSATNIFGRGFSEKRIELIMESYPDAFTNSISDAEKIKKISEIKGMAVKSAEAFVTKIDDFLDFLMETDMFYKLFEFEKQNKEKKTGQANEANEANEMNMMNPFYGKTIVMTGFRNKEVEEKLKKMGAKIGSSVSKNTYMVIAKDKDDETGKVLEAKKLGVTIMNMDEFIASL
jgi:NAD-dependent DNA ligase